MTRRVPTWTVPACAAIAFLAALFLGLGVIESITVAAVASIGWSLVRQIAGALADTTGGPDGARH